MPICLTERPKNVNLVYKENMLRQSTRGTAAKHCFREETFIIF